MPSSGGEKLCPICDSPLQPGSKKCGFCGTDLSIFDIEVEGPKKVPLSTPSPSPPKRTSVESKVDEVMASRSPVPPVPSKAPEIRAPPPAEPVMREEPKPEPPKASAPEPKLAPTSPARAPEAAPAAPAPAEEETFECPQCGTQIPISASLCPKCGVMFAEEGGEMFQCPACNTLVNVDATQCPGCGAVFVEAEQAPDSQTPAVTPPVKEDIELPIEKVRPAPKPSPSVEEKKSKEEPKGEKKGIGGWFKWGKKEPEPHKPQKEETPTVKPGPSRPSEARIPAAHAHAKAAPEVKVVRELKTAEHERPEPAPSSARPSPEIATKPVAAPVAAPQATQSPGGRDKGRDLARMVAEMKPLLALAREKDVDIGESKQLIDDAAVAGKERQLDRALELVQKSKTALMEKIDAHLGALITRMNDEIKIARDFGGDISRATAYIQEVTKARASGDVEAAYVYADKVGKELLPITGRYNESKRRLSALKRLIADCDAFIVDTKEARRGLVDASKAFDLRDFDKTESLIKAANESLYKAIPARMNEEMKKAREELIDLKVKDVNISPMLTVLKSATGLMKSGDYAEALKEMRSFKDLLKNAA